MLCQNCNQNTASYHSVKNVNGHITETYLCNACRRTLHDAMGLGGLAQDLGVFGQLSSLANFLTGISDSNEQVTPTISCSACGTTFLEFSKSLYVGCQHCYRTFSDSLLPMLQSLQHGTTHTGKAPKGREGMERYKQLERELQSAIQEERYEDAKTIKKQMLAAMQ